MSWERLAAELNVEGLQIAMGGSRRISAVVKFGANFGINTSGVPCSLTTAVSNALYDYPSVAESAEIVSSSGNDTAPAGSGMRTVTVEGLDEDWKYQTEEVSLSGTTPVVLTKQWIRYFRIGGDTAGTSKTNEGILTVRPQGGGTTRINMPVGYGQTMHALFTVPAGYVGFFAQALADSLPSTTTPSPFAHVAVVTRFNDDPDRPFRVRNTSGLPIQGRAVIPRLMPEKTDIELRVLEVDKNSSQISGSFDLLLRAKEETRHYLPNIID